MTLYRHPVNRFVAAFLGSPHMNFLQVQASRALDASLVLNAGAAGVVQLPADVAVDANAVPALGWRPEHVQLLPAGEGPGLQAAIERVEPLGDVALVHYGVPGQTDTVTLKLPGEQALPEQRQAAVRLWAEPQHAMLCDAQGVTLYS